MKYPNHLSLFILQCGNSIPERSSVYLIQFDPLCFSIVLEKFLVIKFYMLDFFAYSSIWSQGSLWACRFSNGKCDDLSGLIWSFQFCAIFYGDFRRKFTVPFLKLFFSNSFGAFYFPFSLFSSLVLKCYFSFLFSFKRYFSPKLGKPRAILRFSITGLDRF